MKKINLILLLAIAMITISGCDRRFVHKTMLLSVVSESPQTVELEIFCDGAIRYEKEAYHTIRVEQPVLYVSINNEYSDLTYEYAEWICNVTITEDTGSDVTLFMWKETSGENYSLELIDTMTGTGPGAVISTRYTP